MKILSVDKIRDGDLYTINHEPIADIDLMERAAAACFYWLVRNIPHHYKVVVFCGTGNNGGDGFAVSRLLGVKGFDVEVYLFGSEDNLSANCRINFTRVKDVPEIRTRIIVEGDPLPVLDKQEIVLIDAIFGSGLARPVSGFYASVIHHLNQIQAITVAIDVPSGLFCDASSGSQKEPAIVKADHTLTFSPPKRALFFPENDRFIGQWHLLDIGIMQDYIDKTETHDFYIVENDCRKILKPRNTYSHKGTFGHALLFCGSPGKMGAAVLAARGCLHAGPGLVTLHVPSGGSSILQTAVPEAMLDIDSNEAIISEIPDLSKYNSIAAGPGIGTELQTRNAMKMLIQNTSQPIIFDADAINILAENKTWIPFIPKGSIFTPHPKEFERLTGKYSDDFERNRMQLDFSRKHSAFVILKGAHTAITTPDGRCFFNSTGNPGMATGGSGDVLTGILAGLKAQGYSSLEACILGVYLHGLAGDLAAEYIGQEALIAGNIIEHLGHAFKILY